MHLDIYKTAANFFLSSTLCRVPIGILPAVMSAGLFSNVMKDRPVASLSLSEREHIK